MTAIRAIHVGLRHLGIAEDEARDLYERQTGSRSLSSMSPDQQEAVLVELRRLGFRRSSAGTRKRLEGPYASKLQALWISAWNLGLVRDRKDPAMLAFVKRQTGIDHTRFLHYAKDAERAIEALKKWMERDGRVDWSKSVSRMPYAQMDGYRIAIAQWQILTGGEFIAAAFWDGVASILDRKPTPVDPPSKREWIDVMNELGQRVRAQKAVK